MRRVILALIAVSATAAGARTLPCDRACLLQLTDTYLAARESPGQFDSNGMACISIIANRRLFAADPVTGLAMGFSHFHHAMGNLTYEVMLKHGTKGTRNVDSIGRRPFDLPAAHIFKVGADGKVPEIEAMGFIAPCNSKTGWEG